MTKSVDLSQLAELRQTFPFLNQELLAGGQLLSFQTSCTSRRTLDTLVSTAIRKGSYREK